MRADNPATSFRKRPETARERFLSFDEIQRLAEALCADPDPRAAGIIRLCVLTGARCGEARTATFDQFNLDLAIWTKQAAYTKQRRIHRVPISHEAVALSRLRSDPRLRPAAARCTVEPAQSCSEPECCRSATQIEAEPI